MASARAARYECLSAEQPTTRFRPLVKASSTSYDLTYPDGSIAKITYVTTGDPRYPKEVLEVFGDGKVARMDNFKRTEIWRGGKCRSTRTATVDKGQKHELEAFIQAARTAADMPVTFGSLLATTASTLAVGRSIASGKVEPVAGWERPAEDEMDVEMVAAQ